MKYWLKDFEHNISPSTWEAADQLCLDGQVRNLREIETHFWVARVDEKEGSFETEVIITPQKIKAYSCECFTPGRRLMCRHIAASLLKIRQYLDRREEERRAKAEQAQSNELSRITVQSVLNGANAAEISAFVRDYARRDRDFALALKTWFAGSLSESENPYALVLDSVFPKIIPAKGFKDPDFRRIRKALDGLEVQLHMASGDGNYRGVFQISTAILLKSLPVLDKTEGNRREALVHFCELALKQISELYTRQLSAELRDNAWDVVFDLGQKQLFPEDIAKQAIQFISESGQEADKAERIRNLFDSTPFPASNFTLQLYLASAALRRMPEAIPMILADYTSMPDMLYEAMLQLYYLRHWEAVLHAGAFVLPKQLLSPKQQRELEDILLYVVEQTGDRQKQMELLKARFMKNGNLEWFRKLKTVAASDWPAVKIALIEELSLLGNINLLAAAFAVDGQLADLAQLLRADAGIQLLQRYESYFFEQDPAFLRAQYAVVLSAYLEEHFGSPAAFYARRQLAELAQKGQPDLAVQIARDLVVLFPDRPSLPDELAELLPKSKRKIML